MLLKWMIHRKLSALEREHGYDASYMHEVVDRDVGAFLKFARATGLGSYRKDAPTDTINGLPGFVVHTPGGTETLAVDTADGAIVAIYQVRNPDKVRDLA